MSDNYGVESDVSGRISALKARKMLVEMKIKDELKRPSPSNDVLIPLKITKLCIKEEMDKIKEA